MDKKLNHRIKEIRKEHGFKSQQSFADALNVNLANVKSWEKERNPVLPRLDTLLDMCTLFDCDLDYLTGRIEHPTHDIQFIHDCTGLSTEAIRKLMQQKKKILDSTFSEIIVHKDSERLLRALTIASDEDEISWHNLGQIPNKYSESPINYSDGIGSDIADYLASQELGLIIRSVREEREKEKAEQKADSNNHHWMDLFGGNGELLEAKDKREKMIAKLEKDCEELFSAYFEQNTTDKAEKIEMYRTQLENLLERVKKCSFSEWKRGEIEKEYFEIYGEEE